MHDEGIKPELLSDSVVLNCGRPHEEFIIQRER